MEGGGEGTHAALGALSAGDVVWLLEVTERGMRVTYSPWDPRRHEDLRPLGSGDQLYIS